MSLDIKLPTLSSRSIRSSQRQQSQHYQQHYRQHHQQPVNYSQRSNINTSAPSPQQRQSRINNTTAATRSSNSRQKMVGLPNMNAVRKINIPRSRSELRDAFQPAQGTSGFLLLGWAISGILAIIIPVSKWSAERNKYYGYYGQYNAYEQQQRQYENEQNGNNYGYYNLCSWWNLKCKYDMKRYQAMYGNGENGGGGGGENGNMSAMLPGWFFFFGGSMEEDEREREEMGLGQNDGSMKFVYACTILMFIGMSVWGFRNMYLGKDRSGIIAALLIFGQFSLMNLMTTAQGTIETDNRFFEDSIYGWFGQWAVLVAYTDFWLMVHCFIFAAILSVLQCLDRRAANAAKEESAVLEMGYVQEGDSGVDDQRRIEERGWAQA